ncbi:MAG: glucose-1-phosphate thymidylyltransferase [Bacteroidetes bacterium]|nr:glucose-1-phosphate thymidylyltransferase [Bacteroidota bacterium]
MNFILTDNTEDWKNFLPLTFTRPISEIRIGILTIVEKWNNFLNTTCSYSTVEHLSKKYKIKKTDASIYINSSVLPDKALVDAIISLKSNEKLIKKSTLIAFNSTSNGKAIEYPNEIFQLKNLTDIFTQNEKAFLLDYLLITQNRSSKELPQHVTVVGDKSKIFIEEGAQIGACILNTNTGAIYVGKNAEVMDGCSLRGSIALCENSAIKMGAKIYGATTIGPHCKVGGEINNSIIFGYSNKAHDGFLGNSVIGEWCNLGADTNNSNLKNNYANVKLYNYGKHKAIDTGLQFCGLIMGDHSKSAINTMFNTGTVVGIAANIFGEGFPPTHIPSFTWGGAKGFDKYDFNKFITTAKQVYSRRGLVLNDVDIEILQHIHTS